jgi:hypothetical protein
LSHNQGATFATKDEAHQFIRNAHANAIKNGTLSDKWMKKQTLPQFSKEQGVAEATGDKRFDSTLAKIIKGAKPNTPEKFIKGIKKVAKTKYKFQVGDWVTIDPNETAKWPSSGMIGRISRISTDGTAVVNVNPGGGASGGGSSGTHTSVPTSMLEKLAVNLDDPGVAEGSLNEFQDTSGKYGGGGGSGGGGDGQHQRIAKKLIKYAEKQGLRPGTIEVGYSSETGVYQVTGLAMNHNAKYDWRYKLDPYAKKLVAVDATQTDAEYAPDNFVPVVFDDVSESAGQGVAEDLDADQKRVGQLGPTGGPAKPGDLVGTNENFINTVDQAVVSEEDEVAEGKASEEIREKVKKELLQKYGKGKVRFSKTDKDNRFATHEDDLFGDTHSHQYDRKTGILQPSHSRSTYYDDGLDEMTEGIVKEGQDELARILQIMNHRR